jgi:hypothetical protein
VLADEVAQGAALDAHQDRVRDAHTICARKENESSEPPESGLPDNEAIVPGAQTERRGDAGPVDSLLRGRASPAALFAQGKSLYDP